MNHKRVVRQWYEVSFETSHRCVESKIQELMHGAPDLDYESWDDNHSVIRDFEGDFEGIHIYNTEETKELISFLCGKLGISYKEYGELDFKLVT